MIRNFKCKETEKLFRRFNSRKFPPDIKRSAIRKLWMINAAININDLRIPPSNHLEKLNGDRADQLSIRINEKWRVCFSWIDGNAHNVEIINYH